MAPGGGNKRKRPERQSSREDGSRPSPHRPQDLALAQQSQQHGGSRGGRGGGRQPSRQTASSPANVVSNRQMAPSPTPVTPQATGIARDSPAVEGSRSATPSQSIAATIQPPAEDTPTPPPAPYWYDHLTDAIVESWAETGKSSILELAGLTDEMTLCTLIQELLRAGLDGRLRASEAGSVIRDMIAQHKDFAELDVQSLFVNTLSVLDDIDQKNSNLLAVLAASEVDPDVIRLELDDDFLKAVPLVRSTFSTIKIRKTTNILYRQVNFNLLREESEGYAKLITEYYTMANAATNNRAANAEQAFERITALVGSFDLDVGRVLDITLDISANLLVRAYAFIIKFYRCSSWWPESGVIDNVQWDDQGFNSFPAWALPGAAPAPAPAPSNQDKRSHGIKEALHLAIQRETRDIRFWERVQEVGMEAFFELGARKIVNFDQVLPLLQTEAEAELNKNGHELNADRRKRINENRKFMADTGAVPPSGNSDAAQLLGFKLRFYASSARDAQDTLPENVIFLAALLIKIGFISLRDLYPHLYPADEKMSEEKTRLEREKAEKETRERPGVASNALAMAGALTDDTLPTTAARALRNEKEKSGGSTPKPEKREEEAKNELPAPSNQKLMLLKALLLIGALPEAFYILGRFPWLVDVDYTLPPYLHRIANQMLSKVAEMVRPLSQSEDAHTPKDELASIVPHPDGTLFFQPPPQPQKKSTRWLGLDSAGEKGDGLVYYHYYPDWYDNIPLCQNVEDVVLLCNSFLGYLGVKIGQDAKLLGTLVRVAKYSLVEDFSEENQMRWLDLMRRLLVPALSLSKHNAGLTQEVYELLKFFPTTTRYNIYAEWYLGKTSRLPDMRVAFDHNKAEVKDVLRRVTNESGKKQARALAKVSFSSPGNVMKIMIDQLESYSNMIPSLVECTRYFPLLAYDVLTWSLINSLSGQGRSRIQADGMLTSSWLQALSSFVASLFYRYTALNPSPILQYLASELRAGNSTDLEMFEQLLAEMAGIRSDMEFNDAQVLAMAGGKILQGLTVQQLADKRHERKTQAQRLIKALSDPGLIGQTLISIAQERQMYPYHDSSKNMPLKVLGNNLDKIQLVFAQYLDVLKTNLDPVAFEAAVPDAVRLVAEFGLDPGIAFTICRFCIAQRIVDFDAAKKVEQEEKKKRLSNQGFEQLQMNGHVEVGEGKDEEDPMSTDPAITVDSASESIAPGEAKPASLLQALTTGDKTQTAHPVLQPIIQQLIEVAPQLASKVSISFFVTFWTRSLQDIVVPSTSYDSETSKFRAQVRDLNADRTDSSASASRERDRKKKALAEAEDQLREELKGRISSYQKTRNRISREEKDHWFTRSMDREESDARHLGLLQECFLPRTMLSSLDAQYSFLMLKILHDNGTPGFSTMRFLAQLFRKQELATLIFQCTAMEAAHFGRFLCETLKLLTHWHNEKATYEREALGEKQKLPGFAKTLDANGEPQVVLDYEEFRRLLYNWHSFLHGALQLCFESSEYMYIRNGITVLRAIVQVFPSLNFMGHNMVKQVTKLSDEETRQDLKLAGKSLLGPLRSREKAWMMPQAFRLNDPSKEAAGKGTNRSASARPETPQPSTTLNAAAAEFKPSTSLNGGDRKVSIAGREDGEIEDEKLASVQNGDTAVKESAVRKAVSEDTTSKNKPDAKSSDSKKSAEPLEKAKATARPTTKPPTTAAIPAKPPPPEYGRSDSARPPLPHTTSSRAHGLPSRPPGRPLPAPYGGRDEAYGRLSRPSDLRPSSRDHSPGRSRPRTPERDPYHGHSTPNRAPRDDRGPPRSARDDTWMSSRRDQPPSSATGRTSHDARDRSGSGAASFTGPSLHHERGAPATSGSRTPTQQAPRQQPSAPPSVPSAQADTQHHENPARLALINKEPLGPRERGREPMPSQEPRRGPSDLRSTAQETSQETSRTDRPSDLAPTGPKRSSGRLSRDFGSGAPADSASDRVNGAQDFPAGQRPPNGPSGGRGGRGGWQNEPSSSSPSASRPADPPSTFRPTGPRQVSDRRQPPPQFERQSPANSLPTTPATENAPQVHPSRLNQLDMQPPPIQTNLPASGARNTSSPVPPSAPRGAARPPAGTPTGPSSANNGPPSGPAAANERQRRTGGRQIGSINATLQGTNNAVGPNGQAVNFRGAASTRQPTGPSTTSAANPQSVQAIASPLEPPSRRSDATSTDRPDRPSSRADPPPRADLFQSKMGPNHEDGRTGRPRRGEEDYPERQRSSRTSSRERPGNHPPPPQADNASRRPDERRPRDDRGGRDLMQPSSARYSERAPRNDDYGRPPPPSAGGPNPFPSQQPPNWDRSGDRRGPPRREGPSDSERTRGNAPSEEYRGGRREDERPRDSRQSREYDAPPPPPPPPPPPLPGNRKRRHEDAPPFEDAKRRRSGR